MITDNWGQGKFGEFRRHARTLGQEIRKGRLRWDLRQHGERRNRRAWEIPEKIIKAFADP